MRQIKWICFLLFFPVSNVFAQSTGKTMKAKPVIIFSSDKAINTNTTSTVGKGKMDFKVTHNFGDIAGKAGGIKNFFGLDNTTDVRIGFEVGLMPNLDAILARSKGAGLQQREVELGMKYRFLTQTENVSTHPLSMALYLNSVIATNAASTFPNQDNSYKNFGDRITSVVELIISKKIGKISLQMNPSLLLRNYSISYDQKNFFTLGGAIRFPIVSNRLNLLVDYVHPFRQRAVKDSFSINENIHFYDPLGVGFEIITGGHVFRLNFTNATEIIENRFIPRTITNWGKGQFRWGFTISRRFTIWR
ncbi:MAG: hypothetical protein KDC06_08095 [Chitinophagaceae bacterium]|nr:hypothetical protein [Chitinophagaceae bacterium]